MIIVNYGHPLTKAHLDEIAEWCNDSAVSVRDIRVQVDRQRPLVDVANELIDAANIRRSDPVLINPPGLAPLAVVVFALWRRRFGITPPMLNLRPVAGALPPQFEVAEIVSGELPF